MSILASYVTHQHKQIGLDADPETLAPARRYPGQAASCDRW
jgi:hypothetical protein